MSEWECAKCDSLSLLWGYTYLFILDLFLWQKIHIAKLFSFCKNACGKGQASVLALPLAKEACGSQVSSGIVTSLALSPSVMVLYICKPDSRLKSDLCHPYSWMCHNCWRTAGSGHPYSWMYHHCRRTSGLHHFYSWTYHRYSLSPCLCWCWTWDHPSGTIPKSSNPSPDSGRGEGGEKTLNATHGVSTKDFDRARVV